MFSPYVYNNVYNKNCKMGETQRIYLWFAMKNLFYNKHITVSMKF